MVSVELSLFCPYCVPYVFVELPYSHQRKAKQDERNPNPPDNPWKPLNVHKNKLWTGPYIEGPLESALHQSERQAK